MTGKGPYHEGEIAIQNATGEREFAIRNSAAIRGEIFGGALDFVERQSLVAVGSESAEGRLWASVLFGRPGFMRAPGTKELHINLNESVLLSGDPVVDYLRNDPRIAMLIIELETRRRLKVNGNVTGFGDNDQLDIAVLESFPLCPKYIQRRAVQSLGTDQSTSEEPYFSGTAFGEGEVEVIRQSDTMFVVTAHPSGHLDVSHKGGRKGFIEVVGEKMLRIPDFFGNSMFRSFGNLQIDDRASVVILDFAGRRSLQISGRARVLLDQPDPANQTGGSDRFWTLQVEYWQRGVIPALELQFFDYSPFLPKLKNKGSY